MTLCNSRNIAHDWEILISKKINIVNHEFSVDNHNHCTLNIYQCNNCRDSYCRLIYADRQTDNDSSLKYLLKYLSDEEKELLKKWSYITDIRAYKKSLRKISEVI